MRSARPDGAPAMGWIIITDPLPEPGDPDEGALFMDTYLVRADDGDGLSDWMKACTLHNKPVASPRVYDWLSDIATMGPADHVGHWVLSNGRECN